MIIRRKYKSLYIHVISNINIISEEIKVKKKSRIEYNKNFKQINMWKDTYDALKKEQKKTESRSLDATIWTLMPSEYRRPKRLFKR